MTDEQTEWVNHQCSCKQGYVSRWDGKCKNCRTKQEQSEHDKTMREIEKMPPGLVDQYATYRWVRWRTL